MRERERLLQGAPCLRSGGRRTAGIEAQQPNAILPDLGQDGAGVLVGRADGGARLEGKKVEGRCGGGKSRSKAVLEGRVRVGLCWREGRTKEMY